MNEREPTQPSSAEIERALQAHFQILPQTGLSADYFNELYAFKRDDYKMVMFGKIPKSYRYETAEEDAAAQTKRETAVRELISKVLTRIPTYTEWATGWTGDARLNRKYGNVPIDFFISDKTRERVAALNSKIEEMRAIAKAEALDLARLNRLAVEAAILVYGDDRAADIETGFTQLHD